jgi:amino acid permease
LIFDLTKLITFQPVHRPESWHRVRHCSRLPLCHCIPTCWNKYTASIINAVVCTSAFSCGSACLMFASRTLFGLAEEGQAPKIFLKTNRFGTPYMATGASFIFTPLVFLSLGSNSSIVFSWLVNIASIAGLVEWVVIEITYLRFFYGLKRQGLSGGSESSNIYACYPANCRKELPYKAPFQPYLAWLMLFLLVVIVLTSGFSVFFPGQWSAIFYFPFLLEQELQKCALYHFSDACSENDTTEKDLVPNLLLSWLLSNQIGVLPTLLHFT